MKNKNLFVRCALFIGAAALCSAASFTGKVVAGTCQADQPAACEVTESTASYALQLADGKILRLDANGSAEVAKLVKEDLAKVKAGQVIVDGDLDGETITATSVKLAQ